MFRIFTNFGPESDQPVVGNVLNDDTVGGVAGTFANITAGFVALGEQWGEDGTEFTGTGDPAAECDLGIFFLRRK